MSTLVLIYRQWDEAAWIIWGNIHFQGFLKTQKKKEVPNIEEHSSQLRLRGAVASLFET